MEADGRTTIYCLGYPKSGTTYLARLLGDVLDSPVGSAYPDADDSCIATEGKDREGDYHIRQGHSIPMAVTGSSLVVPVMGVFSYDNLTDEAVIYMTRDPRDIIVSASHHWGLSIPETIVFAAKGIFPLSWGGGLIPFLQAWEKAPFHYLTVTYEDLITDTRREVERLLKYTPHGPRRTLQAIERQSFAKRKEWTLEHGEGLTYGKEFQYNFLRRGQVGSWRDEMDEESRELMQKYFGDLLIGRTNES